MRTDIEKKLADEVRSETPDVLDAILARHIDEEQSAAEIARAGFAPAVVDRVVRLVRISEWKRQQAAPGPKVSRRAFGRERRYPITSGWR